MAFICTWRRCNAFSFDYGIIEKQLIVVIFIYVRVIITLDKLFPHFLHNVTSTLFAFWPIKEYETRRKHYDNPNI